MIVAKGWWQEPEAGRAHYFHRHEVEMNAVFSLLSVSYSA